MQAVQEFEDAAIGETIIKNYDTLPKDQGVRPQAIDVLSRRKIWALALIRAVEDKTIDRAAVPIDVLERMKLYHDETIDRAITKNWGALRQSPEQLKRRMSEVQKI